MPRLASPRTRVPAGAVALAGEFAGVYPRDTPGGWRLIGTTGARLFDPDAASPALLAPGTRVRFRDAVAARAVAGSHEQETHRDRTSRRGSSCLRAISCLREPAGRAHPSRSWSPASWRPFRISAGQGRPRSASRARARSTAPRCGPPTACSATRGRRGDRGDDGRLPRRRAGGDLWFAVTGAWGPIALDGREVDPYEAHLWPAGAELHARLVRPRRARLPRGARRVRRVTPRSARARPTFSPGSGRRRCAPATGVGVRDDVAGADARRPPGAVGRAARRRAVLELAPGPAGGLVRAGSACRALRVGVDRDERRRPRGHAPGRSRARPRPPGGAPERGHGAGCAPGAAQRPADDPAGRRAGDGRLPRHRGGDGCLARPARAGSAGHRHPLPARPRRRASNAARGSPVRQRRPRPPHDPAREAPAGPLRARSAPRPRPRRRRRSRGPARAGCRGTGCAP